MMSDVEIDRRLKFSDPRRRRLAQTQLSQWLISLGQGSIAPGAFVLST